MRIYNKTQTFTTDDFQKNQLEQLRKNKVNVSKFIRDAINEKLEVRIDKRKKYTFNDLKESLNLKL